jgi:coenzyme Q-binding protein COQ10
MRHGEFRILPYPPETLFKIVADVERYPEFLPWVMGAKIINQTERGFIADLTVGYRFFKETYRSEVMLTPHERIEVRYIRGPFKYLLNTWKFSPTPANHVKIDFFIDFEFQSLLFQGIIQTIFTDAIPKMVSAFEERARNQGNYAQ